MQVELGKTDWIYDPVNNYHVAKCTQPTFTGRCGAPMQTDEQIATGNCGGQHMDEEAYQQEVAMRESLKDT